ncbi:MAG: HNH endonuclease [Planctomycetaceae bacterium]|nr:HNH endonuclease [Planctomycetaceae bacterium]
MFGTAPTVSVTLRATDFDRGYGRGFIDGAKAPVSMRTIRHLACTGGFELLSIDSDDSVHGMGSTEPRFTSAQRRAILARDGGCAIAGCTIPAAWTEIHHVDSVENGGPTETDNGASPKYDRRELQT